MPVTIRSLCIAAALVFAAVARAQAAGVIVSSKIDTEGSILGSIIADVLKSHGVPVINRVALGPTDVVRSAILAGDIDLYPEYTGNAAFFFGKTADPAWKSPEGGYAAAKRLDFDTNKIVWLRPAPANNSWGIGLRREVAETNHLATLSDFARWITDGGRVKLAASPEFVASPAALTAFQNGYGFKLRPDQLLVVPGGDSAMTIKAAAEQTEGVDAAVVYGTDGGIAAGGLVVLADDRSTQPVYLPTPIIRSAALAEHPGIPALLEPVFQRLDLKTLQSLNARVQVDGEAAADVAHDYLRSTGTLP